MKFLETLKALPMSRQIMLGAAVLGVLFTMSLMIRGATKEPMALLYSGLAPERAGEIINELDQRGITYDIEQESIFVPQSDRDKVRFSLAQEGLPKQAVQGYELLDAVNGFSITSEMYNASYWRAKEGELTRTILAIPGIASARVHIGASLRSGFSRSQPAQTASVTLSTTRDLSSNQAEAIQYLVALAVSGLNPDDVVVIDPRYGILAGPNVNQVQQPAIVAETEAAALEAKILRLLNARLGAGNAQVSVSVDVSRERQLISSVQFDPDSRVIRQRTSNDTSQKSDGGGGALTVASNLPQGATASSGGSNNVKNSTESVSYELNETRTETEVLPGVIERISIAVLLNEQALDILPATGDVAATKQAVIEEFEQLIRSGAGLDIDRGDAITVELMPFKEVATEELVPAPGLVEQLTQRYFWNGLQALLLSIVIIILGLGVIRPILSSKAISVLEREGDTQATGNDIVPGERAMEPVDFLKDYARERQEETAAILQDWLNEDRKVAVNE